MSRSFALVSKRRLIKRETLEFYCFVSPWIIGFTVFGIFPVLFSLYLSFCHYDILTPAQWCGLENYREVFTDELFYTSLWNTVYFAALAVPLGIGGSLTLALLLNTGIRAKNFYRAAFYIPSVAAGVGVALLWKWLFNPEFGLINEALRGVGISNPPGWLMSEIWSKPAFVLMGFWGIGGGAIIFLAGLQGIPQSLYEAARIDGASKWREFLHVTIPMLSPVIFFQLIMGVIGTFQVFVSAYVMTQGGPGHSTLFYVLYLFNKAFKFYQMGYGASMAWILFVIIVILTFLQFLGARRWVHYEGTK